MRIARNFLHISFGEMHLHEVLRSWENFSYTATRGCGTSKSRGVDISTNSVSVKQNHLHIDVRTVFQENSLEGI